MPLILFATFFHIQQMSYIRTCCTENLYLKCGRQVDSHKEIHIALLKHTKGKIVSALHTVALKLNTRKCNVKEFNYHYLPLYSKQCIFVGTIPA
jgi:hypothetical protein